MLVRAINVSRETTALAGECIRQASTHIHQLVSALIISVTNPEEDTAALLSDTRSAAIAATRKCVGVISIPQAMNNLHVNECTRHLKRAGANGTIFLWTTFVYIP